MPTPTAAIGPLQQPTGFELAFRLRQPEPKAPKGCVILLHGVGGNETNLAELATEIDPDILVVLVRGPLELAAAQFAWFHVMFGASGPKIVPEQAEHSRLALIQFITSLQQRFNLDPDYTVVAGFSQGGILSASVALSAPDLVAGFGMLSGRILPELQPKIASPQQLSKLTAFIGHGENDSKLPVVWAHRAVEQLEQLGVWHALHLYPIDHQISAEMQSDFLQWLKTV